MKHSPNRQIGAAAPWLIGCGIALLVVIIAVVVGGFYLFSNAKNLTTDFVAGAAVASIQESNMGEETKQTVVERIEGLATDFKEGDITLEQMGEIMQHLMDGPLWASMIANSLVESYIPQSTLTPEEKEDARQQVQRVVHGMMENQVTSEELNQALEPVMLDSETTVTTSTGEGTEVQTVQSLNPNPTDEQLRQVTENMRTLADTKGIPDQDYSINLGEAIDEAVARAKGEAPAAP